MNQSTDKRYVLEAIDPATSSIDHEIGFDVKDTAELLSALGVLAGEFQANASYPLEASEVAGLKSHYHLQFESEGFEVWLRQRDGNDDLPYKVHTGRELAMMLAGTKPLAVFTDDYPKHHDLHIIPEREFEPHVRSRRIIKREHIEPPGSDAVLRLIGPFAHPCARPTLASQAREPDSPPGFSAQEPSNPLRHPVANGSAKGIRRVLYALPGEEWRMDAYLKLWETSKKTGWTAALEREEGTLLGYEEWQNDLHMKGWRTPAPQIPNS
jgi:hypothetical protein